MMNREQREKLATDIRTRKFGDEHKSIEAGVGALSDLCARGSERACKALRVLGSINWAHEGTYDTILTVVDALRAPRLPVLPKATTLREALEHVAEKTGDEAAADLLADYATLAKYGLEDAPEWVAAVRDYLDV